MEGRFFGIVNKLLPIWGILLLVSCTHKDMNVCVSHCDGTNEVFTYHNNLLRSCYDDSNYVFFNYKNGKIKHVIINSEKDSPMAKLYYALNDIKPAFEQFGIFIEYPEALNDHIKLAHLMGLYDFFSKDEVWRDSLTSNNSHIFISKIDSNTSFPDAEIGHVDSAYFEVKDSCLMRWSYLWDHDYTGSKERIHYDYYYENKNRVKYVKIYTQTQENTDSCTQYFYYKDHKDHGDF